MLEDQDKTLSHSRVGVSSVGGIMTGLGSVMSKIGWHKRKNSIVISLTVAFCVRLA